jgi:signal transduction histidine kinase
MGAPFIVDSIVMSLGGIYRVESRLGQGTIFSIYLPLSKPDEQAHVAQTATPVAIDA